MRLPVLVLALALAALTLAPSSSASTNVGCVLGSSSSACLVSVEFYYCVHGPCTGMVVCVDHGLVCSDALP